MNGRKIVLFGSQITVGGAQAVLLAQAGWFQAHGYEVHAVFFYDKDGLLDEWRAAHDFPIRVLSTYQRGKGMLSNLPPLLRGFFRLYSFLRKTRPDIIECFTHDANLLGIPAAFLARVPCRVGTHHGQFAGLSQSVRCLHAKLINSRLTSRLVCVSARAENQALSEGIHPQKIQIIFNGIAPVVCDPLIRQQTRQTLGLDAQQLMILTVGRLVPEKAQHLLIDAAASILPKLPRARFFIAGDGPLRDELQAQIQQKAISQSFTLLGNRDDVSAILNAADLFVLYSETEGMPVSMMEAMSAGLPIVASTLEGIAQLIPSEENGCLIPFGNANTLAQTILRSLSDAEMRKRQGAANQQRIQQHFSLDASCQSYESLFKAFLS